MTEADVQLPLIAEAAPLIVAAEPFVMFELPGAPIAWERAGATIRFGHGRPYVHFYLTQDQEAYREQIAWAAKAAMRGREPTDRPVALLVHAFVPIPASWHWKNKQSARAGVLLPTSKPDHDNFLKVLCDALRGIVWIDDAGVVDGRCIKRYSDKPALRCDVREFVSPRDGAI
jgi:Holliday junction resolvase RusA-like endonuclease